MSTTTKAEAEIRKNIIEAGLVSGKSTGPHLHFGLEVDEERINSRLLVSMP